MPSLHSIERLHRVIDRSLFYIDGNLDYDRITDAIITLSNAVNAYDGDSEHMWNTIGEFSPASLPDLIVGAYWHYSEWHNGQWSKGYEALSALGDVFSPNEAYVALNSVEYYWRILTKENEAYVALNSLVEG
jgi:hypothetical protein